MHRVHSNGARIREHRQVAECHLFLRRYHLLRGAGPDTRQVPYRCRCACCQSAAPGRSPADHHGWQAGARLFREIKADILVPMHYESWGHFTQNGKELAKVFEEEGIQDKVFWLTPGVSKKVF